jgi:triphosphatase
METEIKFALSPDARARIEQHARPLALVGETSHIDHTTYFDTAGQTLRKAGFSLRVRHRLESGGYVQTVKSVGNGTLHRREWEWPVAAPRPDLARLAEVEALPTLGADGLQPVFRTEVNRSRFVLAPAAGTKLELALDEGAVVADNKSEPRARSRIPTVSGGSSPCARLLRSVSMRRTKPPRRPSSAIERAGARHAEPAVAQG